MRRISRRQAFGLANASMIIGICVVIAWFLMLWWTADYTTDLLIAIFLSVPPIVSLVGLVLGLIGLIALLGIAPIIVRGVVFALIGILLSLFAAGISVYAIWVVTHAGISQLFAIL